MKVAMAKPAQKVSSTLIPTSELLLKLIFNPEHNSNQRRILFTYDRSLSQQVIKDKKQTQMYSALGENKPQLILLNIE